MMRPEPSEQRMTDSPDRRAFPRWKSENSILYKSDHDPDIRYNHGHTTDLSCAGARLSLKEQLPIKCKVKLTLHLSPQKNIELHGVVVWQATSTCEPNSTYQTGLSFYDTSSAVQDLILEHVLEFNRPKVIEQWYQGWKD